MDEQVLALVLVETFLRGDANSDNAVDISDPVATLGFLSMWGLLMALGCVVLTWCGLEIETALTAATVCLGNIGPGLGEIGPAQTYAGFAPSAKLVMPAAQ